MQPWLRALAQALLVSTVVQGSAEPEDIAAAEADDECSSDSSACSLSALQVHASQRTASRIEDEGDLLGVTFEEAKHPPLCDPSIVADTCKNINKVTKEYFDTLTDASLETVNAAELAEQMMVSRHSVRMFLKQLGLNNLETDAKALAKDAFSVSCQQLCAATVASVPAAHRPPSSDVGCYQPSDSPAPVCDVDVSGEAMGGVSFDDQKPTSGMKESTSTEDEHPTEKSTAQGGNSNDNSASLPLKHLLHNQEGINTSGELQALEDLEYPERSPQQLAISISNLFRVYPLTSMNAASGGGSHGDRTPSTLEVGSSEEQSSNSSDARWKDKALKTGVKAQAYTATALRMINTQKGSQMMVRWFGSPSATSKKEARRVLNGVHTLLSNVDYVYPGDQCKDTIYAYVHPNPPHNMNKRGQFIFNLCPLYMDSDLATQMETLTHEASHHRMSLTNDVCSHGSGASCKKAYGRVACERLASAAPRKALKNADNYCYFINDVQPYSSGPTCPQMPKCSQDDTCTCKGHLVRRSGKLGSGASCYTCVGAGTATQVTRSGSNTCQENTGGTCRWLWCKTSRGPVQCVDGKCLCKEGFCAQGGKCSYPEIQLGAAPPGRKKYGCASVNTGGTCRFFGCKSARGPTQCVDGQCHCKPGYCAVHGKCTKA